jgi:crotonobetainyl-CoA hydratase
MAFQFIDVRRDGPVTTIVLDRPEVLNALHAPAHDELSAVFDAFGADPDQWVAIVTGAGDKAFCAGNDLKYQAEVGELICPPSGFGGLTHRFDLAKPIICAVNGLALGGGFEIALACDIIVAADHAQFAFPEPRVGLSAVAGGLHRLPRAIGLSRAMALILTSERVSAAQGQAYGFVHQVVPAADLMRAARALADRIAEASPMAIRASKEAVLRGYNLDLPEALARQGEFPAMAALWASEDVVEGPKAFSEKRPPRWTGR